MPWSSSLAYTVAGASSTWAGLLSTWRSSVRSTSDSARDWAWGARSGVGGGGLWRWRRYQRARASPTAAHPARTPTSGTSSATAWSIISSRPRSPGRCRWRAAPTAPRVSLDLDHLAGLAELCLQALVLLAQPGDLLLAGVSRLASRRLGQRLQRPAVTLLAPLGDQGGVQALTPQQRTLALLVQPLVLLQDLRLVLRRVPPWPASTPGDLRVWIGGVAHRASLGVRVHGMIGRSGHRGTPPRPLSSMIQQLHLPHWR